MRRLFAVITSKRDRAPLQLTYHYGLRASKVSLLQRDDIHETQGRIYIPRVKGSIAKTYPMQPEDVRPVRTYLRTRDDDSPYLFISMRGIPLERRSYWDLMQKYGEGAAIPKPERRFHALRQRLRCICWTPARMSPSSKTGWGMPTSRTPSSICGIPP